MMWELVENIAYTKGLDNVQIYSTNIFDPCKVDLPHEPLSGTCAECHFICSLSTFDCYLVLVEVIG